MTESLLSRARREFHASLLSNILTRDANGCPSNADKGSRIEFGLSRLDAAMQSELADRLRETVIALCETAIAPAALDPDVLTRRVTVAAAMLARAEDQRVIRLHPEDLALIAARLPEDWHFEPDASLERGALRVEGAAGGVEDGPEQWRRAIDEALRQC